MCQVAPETMDVSGRIPDARLEKVRAEFSLTALAYNIWRVLSLVAFDELMAAVKAA